MALQGDIRGGIQPRNPEEEVMTPIYIEAMLLPHKWQYHAANCLSLNTACPVFYSQLRSINKSSRFYIQMYFQPTHHLCGHTVSTHHYFFFFILRFYYLFFRERGREGEGKGEKQRCARETSTGCLSQAIIPGLGLRPRHGP